jgi:hypothetical protein
MATAYSSDGQPKPFKYTMLFKCLSCIMGTGRGISALGTYQWRYYPLIDLYQYDKRKAK